jgi:Raf kinase inhibitor-like YbhB/YbcL family protein
MLEKLPESVGHALINQRAGMDSVVYNQLHHVRSVERLSLTSRAFVFNSRLPTRFTADGEGVSPSLEWDGVPAEASELVLIVEDADSPTPHPLVHAIVSGLGPVKGALQEGDLNSPDHQGVGLATGRNSYLQHAWLPPDPPPGHGEHRYVFQLFALGAGERLTEAPGRGALIALILERAIGVGCLVGTYQRVERSANELEATEVVDAPVELATQGSLA